MSAIDQFLSAMEAAGLTPPVPLHADGKLHHSSPVGKRGDDAGWYVLYLDGVPTGVFGNWRTGETQNWCAKAEDDLSNAERQAMRGRIKAAQRMREVEEARMRVESVSNALAVSEDAASAEAHPYLAAEGVRLCGVGADTERQ